MIGLRHKRLPGAEVRTLRQQRAKRHISDMTVSLMIVWLRFVGPCHLTLSCTGPLSRHHVSIVSVL